VTTALIVAATRAAIEQKARMVCHRSQRAWIDRRPARQGGRQGGDHEEARLRRTVAYAGAAHRYARWALGSSGVGILLAVLALLTR
jgi:hypothetical protein